MMRLLVTRPELDADLQAEALRAAGHEALVEPLLRCEFLDDASINLATVAALAVTSRNGLRALARRPALLTAARGMPVFVVGAGTRQLAAELGFTAVTMAAGTVEDLGTQIARSAGPGDGAVLHVSGEELAGDLGGALTARGIGYRRTVVYRMAAAPTFSEPTLAAISGQRLDGVILMSPRTARIYAGLVERHSMFRDVERLLHFCLSKAVARPLASVPAERICIPQHPNVQELLALVDREAAQLAHASPKERTGNTAD